MPVCLIAQQHNQAALSGSCGTKRRAFMLSIDSSRLSGRTSCGWQTLRTLQPASSGIVVLKAFAANDTAQSQIAHQPRTVQRATRMRSRLSCFQVLRTPYARKFSCHTRWISERSSIPAAHAPADDSNHADDASARSTSTGRSAAACRSTRLRIDCCDRRCTGPSLASAVELRLGKYADAVRRISLARLSSRFSPDRTLSHFSDIASMLFS